MTPVLLRLTPEGPNAMLDTQQVHSTCARMNDYVNEWLCARLRTIYKIHFLQGVSPQSAQEFGWHEGAYRRLLAR